MSNNDFFFGIINKNNPELSLQKVVLQSEKVSDSFFTEQLNRCLNWTGGRLVLKDETSSPPFWDFIKKILSDAIGIVEISARDDININVEATLSCDIYLSKGVVTVEPHWCAYKSMRADEIISTLLVPLHKKGLHDRTFLVSSDGQKERLLCMHHSNFLDEIMRVFILSRYYHSMNEDKISEYASVIKLATEQNLPT
ncbi:hypothetical protein DOH76_24105 [Salmonella enterica subsp. enterica serovar Oranienburg]|nr:hypothetical protein [Salmonella enterica subsp. enterica serovar Oranienburg]EJE9730163.1 hypothetical protein [Salmonella enterica]